MIRQTQKNLETFFQCCSKPIEKVLSSYADNVTCQFKNFYEVEMAANLLQNGNSNDVIYKFRSSKIFCKFGFNKVLNIIMAYLLSFFYFLHMYINNNN